MKREVKYSSQKLIRWTGRDLSYGCSQINTDEDTLRAACRGKPVTIESSSDEEGNSRFKRYLLKCLHASQRDIVIVRSQLGNVSLVWPKGAKSTKPRPRMLILHPPLLANLFAHSQHSKLPAYNYTNRIWSACEKLPSVVALDILQLHLELATSPSSHLHLPEQ